MRNLVKGDARAATSHDKRYQQQINTNKEKNTLMLLELQVTGTMKISNILR
jgi:hypothetical protein